MPKVPYQDFDAIPRMRRMRFQPVLSMQSGVCTSENGTMSDSADKEIVRLCALAMGLDFTVPAEFAGQLMFEEMYAAKRAAYDPLHNDAQAMALVKKFHLHIGKTLRTDDDPFGKWFVCKTNHAEGVNTDLNRAICECIAAMHQATISNRNNP